MSEWGEISLGEGCEILDSLRVPLNADERDSIKGDVPYYGANGLQGFINKAIFDEPLILLAEDGGYFDEYETRPIAYQISGPSWVNNHAHILRVKKDGELDQDFTFYCLQHKNITPFIKGGTRAKLNQSELREIVIPKPPPSTQRRIATILTTLDEVIEATEKLVEKHQQIKAGLMNDLFTRGLWTREELARGDHKGLPCEATAKEGQLRPTPEEAAELYQDSPLGLIPNPWKVTSIEQLLERIIDYRGKTPVKTESGVPLITAKNVRMGFIDPDPREFIAESAYATWMTRGIPKYSDVLFTTEAPLGNVAQIGTTEKVAFAQRVIILQPASWVNPAFLKHLLISAKFQRSVFNLASGTTALGVKQSEFRKVLVCHPERTEEQEAIADRINSMEEQETTQKLHLAKLRQQKQGLMHDLLTGRVRVATDSIP